MVAAASLSPGTPDAERSDGHAVTHAPDGRSDDHTPPGDVEPWMCDPPGPEVEDRGEAAVGGEEDVDWDEVAVREPRLGRVVEVRDRRDHVPDLLDHPTLAVVRARFGAIAKPLVAADASRLEPAQGPASTSAASTARCAEAPRKGAHRLRQRPRAGGRYRATRRRSCPRRKRGRGAADRFRRRQRGRQASGCRLRGVDRPGRRIGGARRRHRGRRSVSTTTRRPSSRVTSSV